MNIFFAEKKPEKIIEALKKAMGERELAKIVSFAFKGKNLIVTISKLGTSILTFTHKDKDEGSEFVLSEEKVALSHKVFKEEVKQKIVKVIGQAGGKVKS